MENYLPLITIGLLAILAEVTYLVVKLPRQNFSRSKQGRMVFVDTSVLMDGRIMAVAQSNFIGDTLVVPRSVIGELQFLADNADHDKRARARHGLDIIKELQVLPAVVVEIMQDGSKAEEGVDERLLKLAKQYNGAICTIDYNLNKVAQVEGISVLNVNELAQSLRMAYLPGERILLEMVQKGQDGHQAVGYLVDGTMVVVEQAVKLIGQTVEIEFIRSLQTAAGKMMFAKLVNKPVREAPTIQKVLQSKKAPRNKPQAVVAEAPKPLVEAVQPVVYHSDTNEAQRVNAKRPSVQRGRRDKTVNPAATPSSTRNNNKPKRAKTSADREAALLDLVDRQ